MGEKAIENRRRGGHVAEKQRPVLRWAIRRDERRRCFMPPDKDLEQVFGRRAAQLLHAEILQHEEIDPRELLHELPPRPRRVGLREIRREIKRAADERAVPGANRADRQRGRDMRLAHAGRTDQQHARRASARSAHWPARPGWPSGVWD